MSETSLIGKVALVTGASRSIGRSVAIRLGESGASVAVNFRLNEEMASETAAMIRNSGGTAEIYRADVTNSGEVKDLVQRVYSNQGPVAVLVNNVGNFVFKPVTETSETEWDEMIASNLSSAFHMIRNVLPAMREGGWGRIVNVGVAGADRLRGTAGIGAYSAAKTALISLTRSVALEEAVNGITVNVVNPGFIETPAYTEEMKKTSIQGTPAGRLGTMEEVAAAVQYFVSDEAAFTTGSAIEISGGFGI